MNIVMLLHIPYMEEKLQFFFFYSCICLLIQLVVVSTTTVPLFFFFLTGYVMNTFIFQLLTKSPPKNSASLSKTLKAIQVKPMIFQKSHPFLKGAGTLNTMQQHATENHPYWDHQPWRRIARSPVWLATPCVNHPSVKCNRHSDWPQQVHLFIQRSYWWKI